MKDDRDAFFKALEAGDMSLSETVRRMRKSVGMTQVEYAKMVGVAPRLLIDLERGVGNPTIRSIMKMIAPFDLELALRRKR